MNKFYKDLNDLFEDRAVSLINGTQSKFIAKRNNIENNEIDIILNEKYFVDVQYSFDFYKYGDIRIDALSAFQLNNDFKNPLIALNHIKKDTKQSFFESIKEIASVQKYGKYLDPNTKCDGVLYFIFKESKPLINGLPDFHKIKSMKISNLVYIPNTIIKQELDLNWLNLKRNFKINDKTKNNIKENHHSAFVCLKLNRLIKTYDVPIYPNRETFNSLFPNYFEESLIIPKNKTKFKI